LKYQELGHNTVWFNHFADSNIHTQYLGYDDYPPVRSTRGHNGSLFMSHLEHIIKGKFINKNGMIGAEYGSFLSNGKITLQNSRFKEITRRLFEGASCDTLVLADRISKEDIVVAEEYGIPYIIGIRENIGIGKAFNRLFEEAKYDKVMILENDWVLIEDKATTERVIKETIAALDGIIHFARLRHVKNPGDPLYTRQFAGREMDSPEHLLDSIHWLEDDLKYEYPDKIGEVNGFLFTDSEFGNHTNNPFMCTKEFYKTHIQPYTGEGLELEGKIREYWQKAHHVVAHNKTGLFTHFRIDR
jgi:hypothetical protein